MSSLVGLIVKKINLAGTLLGLLLFIAGCSSVPFKIEPETDFKGVDSTQVPRQFDHQVGQNFEQLQSVVFRFFGKGFTGIGYLSVNSKTEGFALSCMTPTGITLFAIKGEGGDVESVFLPPQLEKHGEEMTQSLGKDMQRIYLKWTPPPNATVKKHKHYFEYIVKNAAETVSYRYAGPRHLLVEKCFSKGWWTQCVVRYYEYKEFNGKLYPTGIILHNKKFHYKMILRLKEIYPPKEKH